MSGPTRKQSLNELANLMDQMDQIKPADLTRGELLAIVAKARIRALCVLVSFDRHMEPEGTAARLT
jgi:hypothetical protein